MPKLSINKFSGLGWWMYQNRRSIKEATFIRLWKTGDSKAIQSFLVCAGKKEQIRIKDWISEQIRTIEKNDKEFTSDLKESFTKLIEHWSKEGKEVVKQKLTEHTELIKYYKLENHVKELYRKVG